MSANRFTCGLCRCDFSQHFTVSINDTGEIHHFTQPDNARPLHGLDNVFGGNFNTGGFQSGRGRRTARHLRIDIDWLQQRFVVHQLNAGQAEYIGYLVRVGEHAGRAMRDNSPCKLSRCQHAAFDMHVRIAQPRHHILTVHIDDLCFIADAVACIRSAVGKAPVDDCHVV